MPESIHVTDVIPATPERIYQAWMNGAEHGAMTGARATVDATVGGRHTAWDGYIEGTTLELVPSRRIIQSWRSTEFPVEAPDSRIEVLLEAADGGTRITLFHTDIPDGQAANYEGGWHEHYFQPMKRYFGPPAAEARPAAAARVAATGKAAAPAKRAKKVAKPAKKAAKPAKKAAKPAKKAAARKPAARKAKKKPLRKSRR